MWNNTSTKRNILIPSLKTLSLRRTKIGTAIAIGIDNGPGSKPDDGTAAAIEIDREIGRCEKEGAQFMFTHSKRRELPALTISHRYATRGTALAYPGRVEDLTPKCAAAAEHAQ
ncbi:hypothetical protein EVAR_102692_1 [Eumeta japonica]|uniref:Uncharacterized protein n=1 Tax=Eumeta variegata TaxID=151549 RepID=A0A4C1TK76_EUMVA|nr:hypothetical protein EVAR_102692_1 [Eumeta japonica]